MNLRKISAAAAIGACLTAAAVTNVEWLNKSIEYGVIKEAQGKATSVARFVNRGPDPVAVTGIRPSCGCTDAHADKEIALPGDTVTVFVTYDPAGRPGRIEKTTRVFLDADYSYTLPMTGSVIATPATLSSMFPYSKGPLALSAETALLGEMKAGETRHAFINVYNQSADSVRLDWNEPPRYISIDASPRALGPGDIGAISLFYNSRDDKRMANIEIPLEISASDISGKLLETIPVAATARVIPDASKETPEQLKNAPSLYAAPERYDVGVTDKPAVVNFTFTLQNQGHSPLHIYSVASQQPGLRITAYPETLKPDKSGKITGSLDIDKVEPGPYRTMIEVISDDPLHPVTPLYIVGQRYY